MRVFLLLLTCQTFAWPNINRLPTDYAGGSLDIINQTRRCWLEQANDDPQLATRMWFEYLTDHYGQHDPEALPVVIDTLLRMGKE